MYKLQELSMDSAILIRSSRTEYVYATNPNTRGISWDSVLVWNRGIKYDIYNIELLYKLAFDPVPSTYISRSIDFINILVASI